MSMDIDPTAVIGADVTLGEGCQVGPYSIVRGNTTIGADSVIGSHCMVGHPAGGDNAGKPLVIGDGANIRSHTVIYEGSTFGPKLETGHHVLIRENTQAGTNLRAGVFTDIEGECTIGSYCRLHSAVIVGQGSTVGDFVWMYPNTVLPNDPLPPGPFERPCVVGNGVVICTDAMLQPGTVLGEGAYVTAKSFAKGVVRPGGVVAGLNGKTICHVTKLVSREGRLRHPWMRNIADRYPDEAQESLTALRDRVEYSAKDF